MRPSLSRLPLIGRFTRGLRFRLVLSYVLFFTALLTVIGIFFRATLLQTQHEQVRGLLSEEWGAVKAYLRIERGQIYWYFDPADVEESFIVSRLRQVDLVTDSTGKMLETSDRFKDLPPFKPAEIARILDSHEPSWSERIDKTGTKYLVRSGLFVGDNNARFFVAIGRSLTDGDKIVDAFSRNYFLMLPIVILLCSFLGWWVAGRALSPVNDVATTAQRITGSNLTTQISTRGADDELDRLIDSFNRMIQRLNDSFTQTRQFSTDVSHELRTPLTAVRGQLEVALFAATTIEQYRDAIVDALQDVERLSQTIRALLLLSQAESGQVNLQRQVLDLGALVADIVDQFQIPAEAAKLELTSSLPSNGFINADRIQIERLVSNLLSNAVKYTPEGGAVHVALRPEGDCMCFEIQDTGMGIPADHLPHIFDRFYRVPGLDRNPERGLGLGLSFVAWIVRVHGGSIDVKSKLGVGTKFTILLPVGDVGTPQADQLAQAGPEVAASVDAAQNG